MVDLFAGKRDLLGGCRFRTAGRLLRIRAAFSAAPGGIATVENAHPRRKTAHMEALAVDDELRKVRAALEQIDQSGEVRNFPGPQYEKLALFTFARTRGLIAWQRTSGEHELTEAGRMWLKAQGGRPQVRRKKSLSRLIGAMLAVTVLASAWFSAHVSQRLFGPPPSTAAASVSAAPASTE